MARPPRFKAPAGNKPNDREFDRRKSLLRLILPISISLNLMSMMRYRDELADHHVVTGVIAIMAIAGCLAWTNSYRREPEARHHAVAADKVARPKIA